MPEGAAQRNNAAPSCRSGMDYPPCGHAQECPNCRAPVTREPINSVPLNNAVARLVEKVYLLCHVVLPSPHSRGDGLPGQRAEMAQAVVLIGSWRGPWG